MFLAPMLTRALTVAMVCSALFGPAHAADPKPDAVVRTKSIEARVFLDDRIKADAALAGEKPWVIEPAGLNGLRLAVPQNLVLDDLDFTVSRPLAMRLGGDATSVVRGSGLDLAEIREYQPGDDIRLLDWGASGQKN